MKPKLIKLFDLNPTFGVDYLRKFHFCQTICVQSTALVLSLRHTKLFIFYHSIYVVLITDAEMNCAMSKRNRYSLQQEVLSVEGQPPAYQYGLHGERV